MNAVTTLNDTAGQAHGASPWADGATSSRSRTDTTNTNTASTATTDTDTDTDADTARATAPVLLLLLLLALLQLLLSLTLLLEQRPHAAVPQSTQLLAPAPQRPSHALEHRLHVHEAQQSHDTARSCEHAREATRPHR